MAWWLAGAVVVGAVIVLIVAVAALRGSLRRLRSANGALQRRRGDTSSITDSVAELRRRTAMLQAPMALAEQRSAALKRRRSDAAGRGELRRGDQA